LLRTNRFGWDEIRRENRVMLAGTIALILRPDLSAALFKFEFRQTILPREHCFVVLRSGGEAETNADNDEPGG
jgi:hypothetical protein